MVTNSHTSRNSENDLLIAVVIENKDRSLHNAACYRVILAVNLRSQDNCICGNEEK